MKKLKDRLNKENRNLLIAMAIGDGYVQSNKQLKISHSWKQYAYLKYKQQLLKDHGIKCGVLSRFEGKNGYCQKTIQYRLCTSTYHFNAVLRRIMYKNGIKVIPYKLLMRVDALGLAIICMDDGSILRRKYKGKYKGFYFRISTYCSEEQADVWIKYFNDKWNLYPTKVCEKKGYTINFGAEQGRKLFDIIKSYVCPSMMYKILPEMSDLKNYYGTTVLDEIIALSTLPEDKKVMEAHTTQQSEDIV